MSDIFDNNIPVHERLSESLRELGVNTSIPIVNTGNTNISSSSYTALLELDNEQKLYLENIINTAEKTNTEKYILCVNVLSS